MRSFLVMMVFTVATACVSQGQHEFPAKTYDTSVEWVNIRVPKYPPLARQARIIGTVTIEVRFRGCELDPESTRVLSGHPMLAPTALESLKQSTLRCGDFANSKAIVNYEFGAYNGPTGCEDGYPHVEVFGSRVRVLATSPCVEPLNRLPSLQHRDS